jgi:hypothetical protein
VSAMLKSLRSRLYSSRLRRTIVALVFGHGIIATSPSAAQTVATLARSVAAPSAEPPTPEQVWVHIDGPVGLRLEQDLDSRHHADSDWNPVCESPCNAFVPTTLDLRVAGAGRKPSSDSDCVLRTADEGPSACTEVREHGSQWAS